MRDTKLACIAKHSKQNDKMRDIPDFGSFLLSWWGTWWPREGINLTVISDGEIWGQCLFITRCAQRSFDCQLPADDTKQFPSSILATDSLVWLAVFPGLTYSYSSGPQIDPRWGDVTVNCTQTGLYTLHTTVLQHWISLSLNIHWHHFVDLYQYTFLYSPYYNMMYVHIFISFRIVLFFGYCKPEN